MKTEIRREELKNEGIAALRQFASQNLKGKKYGIMNLEGKRKGKLNYMHHFDFIDRLLQQDVVDDLAQCDEISIKIRENTLEIQLI